MKLTRHSHETELYSGHVLDLLNPDREVMDLADIAMGLAKACRYTGQVHGFYSVAEHSVLIADKIYEYTRNAQAAMAGLLHDAHEAYTGDMPRPWKNALAAVGVDMVKIKAVEHGLAMEIRAWAGLPETLSPLFEKMIKNFDRRICLDEKAAGFPASANDWELGCDPLGVEIKMLEWGAALNLFLVAYHRYSQLMQKQGAAAA